MRFSSISVLVCFLQDYPWDEKGKRGKGENRNKKESLIRTTNVRTYKQTRTVTTLKLFWPCTYVCTRTGTCTVLRLLKSRCTYSSIVFLKLKACRNKENSLEFSFKFVVYFYFIRHVRVSSVRRRNPSNTREKKEVLLKSKLKVADKNHSSYLSH